MELGKEKEPMPGRRIGRSFDKRHVTKDERRQDASPLYTNLQIRYSNRGHLTRNSIDGAPSGSYSLVATLPSVPPRALGSLGASLLHDDPPPSNTVNQLTNLQCLVRIEATDNASVVIFRAALAGETRMPLQSHLLQVSMPQGAVGYAPYAVV